MSTREDATEVPAARAEANQRYPSGPDHVVPHTLATRRSDFHDGWLAALAHLRSPEVLDDISAHLEAIHWDGTGCGDPHSPGACSNCFGPSPMSASEVTAAVVRRLTEHPR